MTTQEPLFYSVKEAAARLGVGKTLLYEEINAGRFPATRIGRRVLISRLVVEKMAQAGDDTPQ